VALLLVRHVIRILFVFWRGVVRLFPEGLCDLAGDGVGEAAAQQEWAESITERLVGQPAERAHPLASCGQGALLVLV